MARNRVVSASRFLASSECPVCAPLRRVLVFVKAIRVAKIDSRGPVPDMMMMMMTTVCADPALIVRDQREHRYSTRSAHPYKPIKDRHWRRQGSLRHFARAALIDSFMYVLSGVYARNCLDKVAYSTLQISVLYLVNNHDTI